jgi:hypothetical protein
MSRTHDLADTGSGNRFAWASGAGELPINKTPRAATITATTSGD